MHRIQSTFLIWLANQIVPIENNNIPTVLMGNNTPIPNIGTPIISIHIGNFGKDFAFKAEIPKII